MAKTVNVYLTVEADAQGGAKIGVTPWVVDIDRSDKIEWVYNGAPELWEIEVTLKKDTNGFVAGKAKPVGGYSDADLKKNEKKKNKLDFEFPHHSGGTSDPDYGRYQVMLVLIGLGAVALDPGYRVYP